MADAWQRYRRMRLGVYLPGDHRWRTFIRPLFADALRASWTAHKTAARQAQALHCRNEAIEMALIADSIALEIAAATLSPVQRLRRIGALREELRLLPYRPLSIDIAAAGARLAAELSALETIAQTERKAA